MSDSDERPDLDESAQEVLREIGQIVEDAKAQGQVLLSGPATVQLMVKVEDALTPQEAVELVIRQIAHIGLDAFTFAVTDPLSDDDYYVRGGQLIGLDELEAQVEAPRQ